MPITCVSSRLFKRFIEGIKYIQLGCHLHWALHCVGGGGGGGGALTWTKPASPLQPQKGQGDELIKCLILYVDIYDT
jgi:hypothetical protein